jgi:hypothetical protein
MHSETIHILHIFTQQLTILHMIQFIAKIII